MAYTLNKPWEAVENRTEKCGVSAYLTASANTAVTTSYTKLLGTFSNKVIEDFEIDGTSGKLTYRPADGITRIFKLDYACTVSAPNVGDIITIGVEAGDGAPVIIPGSETSITCRTAGDPYFGGAITSIELVPEDTIEIQIKGDASFTATVEEFSTSLVKMF